MPKIKPSSSVLPARYVYTNVTAKITKSQHSLESDEDTLSAMESEGTLTADDSEKEMDSDSTVLNGGSRKIRHHYTIFKIKDEVPDSDEDNGLKQQEVSTSDAVIKQESQSDHENNACNSVDHQYLNVKIKEEKDLCVTDTCVSESAVTGSKEDVVGSEPINTVLQSSLVKENCGNNSTLKCNHLNHLELPSTDAGKHSENEIVSELSAEDATGKSREVNYVSDSPPKVETEKLNIREANSDVLSSSGYESETGTENMKTPPIRPTISPFQTMDQTPQSSPRQSNLSTSNCNSAINVSENSCNKNQMKNLKANKVSDIPAVNSLNTEAIENENDAYLYSSEAENEDISHFNSTTSVCSMQSDSATANDSAMASQNSTLCVQTKTTVHSCVSPKEKVQTLSENESYNTASPKKKICQKDARKTPPVMRSANSATDADEHHLPRDLIEFSKFYMNFSKSDLEKCLDYVSKKKLSPIFNHLIFFGSDNVKVTKSEKPNIFSTVNAETVRPCVKELSVPLINSEGAADMIVEENSSVNCDNSKICDQDKCSEPPSIEKADDNSNSNELSHMVSEVKSYTESVGSIEEKTNKCDNFKVCDQNVYAEVPSSENNDDFENFNIDSRFARVLSEVASYEAVVTNKEDCNVKCDNFKVSDDQNVHSEVQSSQKDDDNDENSIRFDRLMAEIIRDASKMNEFSSKTAHPVQSAIENTPIITPAVQNEMTPVIKIKQEKIDSMSGTESLTSYIANTSVIKQEKIDAIAGTESLTSDIANTSVIKQEKIDSISGTESLTSDIANTSVQPDTELFSEESNKSLIPSIEDLQKIIETTTLLTNPLSLPENKSNSLNSPPEDVKIKIEPPEIEEITLEGDIPVYFNVNRATHESAPATADDDIKMLIIKKKKNSSYKKTLNRAYKFLTKKKKESSLQRTLNRFRSGCDVSTTDNRTKQNRIVVPNNNFGAVNVSCKSDTFKTAAQLHGRKSAEICLSRQNIDYNRVETIPNNIFKDIVIKIENTGDYSNKVVPNDSSKENGGTSSSSSKRTVYVLNQPDTSFNSDKGRQNTQNEPPVKKMKNTPPTAQEENFMSTSSFTYNETNNCCTACKRKAGEETENMKKIKSEEKEHVETSFPNRDDEKNLGQGSVFFDRMLPSAAPLRKHVLTYSAVSLPPEANRKHSSASDPNSNNESGAFSNVMYSKVSVSEKNCQKPSKSMNEISPCDVNVQSSKQIENNNGTFQTSSSDRNSSHMIVSSTSATHSKASVCQTKNQNPSKLRKEMVSFEANTQPINSNPEEIRSDYAPLLFLNRRGRDPVSLHKRVGKSFMDINDLPSLILEWNANWLIVQRRKKTCAPICKATNVKDSYETELEYYNTYFPLHLLSIWLEISYSWKNCPPCFSSAFENQVEKPSFVKISLAAVLDATDFQNWPKREDIVLFSAIKSDGSEESLFGRVCNVMAKDYNPPADSSLKDKASTLKKVKVELFSAELLDVPCLAIVKVQILSNMRIALLQNDALQNLNSSLKDVILNPKKHISRWKFIALCASDKFALEKSMKSIFESVTSQCITVIDTPTSADGIFAITQLTTDLINARTPVLIGLKNEESFLRLANSMKRFNPILAIKKRDVNLPEELKRFTLEERSAISRDIFQGCHVTLTLLSSVFLGDFTSAFSNQNLTCILHEAHLCTETETALLLYYDVKNLVLFGNQEAQTCTHPLLKNYGYDISLFHRFCRVMSMYVSF